MENGQIKQPIENAQKPSAVEEAKAVLEQITKAKEELKSENDRKENIKSEELLAGSAGGHIEAKQVSPEEKKKAGAKDFFKGTQLEKDIEKC